MEPSGAPWRVLETNEAPAASDPGTARPAAAVPWTAIAIGVAAVAVAVAAVVFGLRPQPLTGVDGAGAFAAGAALVDRAPASPGTSAVAGEVVVAVSGAVAHPGVYRLPAGGRVGDAILAAGGYGSSADAALADRQLNLAAIVRDGDKIRVPVRGEAPAPAATGGTSGDGGAENATGGLVDLNHATAEALDTLPGVGPATAAKIIAAREEQPFASVDDLAARKVVGAATLEKLRALVTVGP